MSSIFAYAEYSVVRTNTAMVDEQGRPMAVGSRGTIVLVHPVPPGETPAYEVEVLMFDEGGAHNDSHLFTARHDQLDLES